MRGVRELGDLGDGHEAAAEHLVHVHLGDAARGLVRVVVVLDIDDEASSTPAIFAATSFVSSSSSPGSMKAEMLSLA